MHYLSVVLAVASGIYAAYTGMRGLNKLPPEATVLARIEQGLLILVGGFIAIGGGCWAYQQVKDNDQQTNLIRAIAIANGINPSKKDAKELAESALKKQLGTEAVNLAKEIHEFIAANPPPPHIFGSLNPSEEERAQNFQKNSELHEQYESKMRGIYSTLFLGRAISLASRIVQTHAGQISPQDMQTLASSYVISDWMLGTANLLDTIGQTLIKEAQ